MFAARSVSNVQRRRALPAYVNSIPQLLIPINLKPRRINTYALPPRFAVFCQQSPAHNSFISNTYKKTGGRGPLPAPPPRKLVSSAIISSQGERGRGMSARILDGAK